MRRLLVALTLAGACAVAVGCSPGRPTVPADEQDRQQMLEVYELLQLRAQQSKKPPQKPADLKSGETAFPTGFAAVQSGEVVVVWGTSPTGSGGLLAYQKSAPTSGGWVLLQGGTVKPVTAEEFKTTPKAGG